MLQKIKLYILAHKFMSVVALIALIALSHYGYKKFTTGSGETKYMLGVAQKGTIVVSITGSGQVSALNQLDLKPKASGDIASIGVHDGEEVKAGRLVAELNAQDAEKSLRDAEVNLESAKLTLEKLQKPADTLSVVQAQNALAASQDAKTKAIDDLKKAYDDGLNMVSNAFLDLPGMMTGIHDMFFASNIALGGTGQWSIDYYADAVKNYDEKVDEYRKDTNAKYTAAREKYNPNFDHYKAVSRFSDTATIEAIINETYETAKNIAETAKSGTNLIQFYEDKLTERNLKPVAIADIHLANLNIYTGKLNTDLLNLLGALNAIQNDKNALTSADRAIVANTESLRKLQAGSDALDIAAAELSIKQRANALLDAREKLADYSIRAPFDGVIAKVSSKKSDSVSAGTAVATLITKQKLAEISFNEVDVAKITIGQKATLTFDAVPHLSLTGEVAEIDTIGTVTQGVVTYTIKIGFDTQDDRVKSGMSVSAAVITDVKQDVLTASNSAIKAQGDTHYVEMLDQAAQSDQGSQSVVSKTPPRRQQVEVGLSNDSMTEITSGLKEGDQFITRTIVPTANTTTQVPSLFGSPGGNRGGGGGALRISR